MTLPKFITFDWILVILIVAISAGLLVFNRLDTEPHLSATNVETNETIARGEIIKTADEYATFKISESTVHLSKNTELKLVDGRKGQIDLQLIQGRIVINGSATISIREVDITAQGQVSIVHYSWLDEIEVATMQGQSQLQYNNKTTTLENESIRMQTLTPYIIENIEFNPNESSEADFYAWVLE